MLIQQVRMLLQKYSEEELRLLAAEIYKHIPKKVIEEKEIDALLEDLQAVLQTRKQSRKTANLPDFEAVAWEAKEFLEDAKQQYYFAPNRVIPKSQRPKWRFIAKRLHDELLALGQDEKHLPQVSDLMTQLYGHKKAGPPPGIHRLTGKAIDSGRHKEMAGEFLFPI